MLLQVPFTLAADMNLTVGDESSMNSRGMQDFVDEVLCQNNMWENL
jgi:hypothetical protein